MTGPATIALLGNPNTGKSTLFCALSGVRQQVANYPGVTVEKRLGRFQYGGRNWTLIDLPGTYSLAPRSPDEMVVLDVLLGREPGVAELDCVVCVVDASNLERNLYLVSQVLELGLPVVVVLTMVDVARSHGVAVDVVELSRRLGVPVVAVQPRRRVGLEELRLALQKSVGGAAPNPDPVFPEAFQEEVARLGGLLGESWAGDAGANRWRGQTPPRFLVERLLLDPPDGSLERTLLSESGPSRKELLEGSRQRLAKEGMNLATLEPAARYGWVGKALEGVVSHPTEPRITLSERLDKVLTHRLFGTLILGAILVLIFQAVFTWAEFPMDLIDSGIGSLTRFIEARMSEGPLRSLVIDGVIGGIGAVVTFLPQIVILFFCLALLEDCGYLARAAYLMDRFMVPFGLSGKSFIPLLSSFACAIPGIMSTRVIDDRRDRLTTILIAPLMSCSARLPVYTLMAATFIPNRRIAGGVVPLQGLALLSMYLLGVVVAALVSLLIKRGLFSGATSAFVMELPAYKWPSPQVVFHRLLDRCWDFLHNAGTIIFAVSVLMWAVLYYPRLSPALAEPFLAQEQAQGQRIEEAARTGVDEGEAARLAAGLEQMRYEREAAQKRQSFMGRAGRLIEPVVRPLGWDWRIGTAVLASFPAREVVVATLGVIFEAGPGAEEDDGSSQLQIALRQAHWESGQGKLFTLPVALSLMVFFSLCAQCVSTLAVIYRETGRAIWPLVSFFYMTALAYLGAFLTYQVGTWFMS